MLPISLQNSSRRIFIRNLGAGLATRALAPQLLLARAGQQANAPIILGAGNHKYEWVRGWGKLPEGLKLGSTHGGVVVDAKNRIYISTDGEGSILVFDQAGN